MECLECWKYREYLMGRGFFKPALEDGGQSNKLFALSAKQSAGFEERALTKKFKADLLAKNMAWFVEHIMIFMLVFRNEDQTNYLKNMPQRCTSWLQNGLRFGCAIHSMAD